MHDDIEDTPDIVERAGGGGWLVGGQCMMYEFLDHFGLDEAMQDYEFTTVAGLILHTLERMPTVGECVRWGEFTFEVVDMDGPRIDKVIVKKVPDTPAKE